MRAPSTHAPRFDSNALELESLQLLPCGCVTSVRRVRPWEYLFVSIEAKGPHCVLGPHRVGRVVQIGNRFDLDDDTNSGG